MAQAQGLQESLQALMILALWIFKLLVHLWIIKINVSNTVSILYVLWLVDPIFLGTNRKLLKLHNVLGESASLVTENIVNHA